MAKNTLSKAIAQHAGRAIQALRDRDFATAVTYFDKLGKPAYSDDRLAKAAGFAHLQLGNDVRALIYLTASLKGRASQPDVHAALGDIYVRRSDQDKALQHLRKATALASEVPDLHYKLGLALITFDRFDEAVHAMRAALVLNPQYAKARLGLARALTETGKLEQAEAELQQAKSLAPDNYAVSFRLGKLRERQQRFDDAISYYKDAEMQSGYAAPVCEALALAELESGDAEAALAALQRGLERTPLDRNLLKHAADLRYELGDPDAFSHYANALESGTVRTVLADYISRLIIAECINDAQLQLDRYAGEFGRGPDWIALAAQLHYSQRNYDEMFRALALTQAGNDELVTWKVKALLGCGQVSAAQDLLLGLHKKAPHDQYLLALLSSCYRLNDKAAYDELVNYANLLRRTELAVPDGFGSLASFNEALRETLQELHITRTNPLSQSVVGGTQTPGNLLNNPHPVLAALKQAFHATLSRELGPSHYGAIHENHPVQVGRGRNITLPAAWSIWTTEGGYHRPHVHQNGWYSSAYYVSLPGSMSGPQGLGQDGVLAFGRPGVATAVPLEAERVVTPTEGVLVLFPSYFWHETLPFRGSDPRVVVAFDAQPV